MADKRNKSQKRRKPPIEVLQELLDQLDGIDSILPAPLSSRSDPAVNPPENADSKPRVDVGEEDVTDEGILDKESDLSEDDIEGSDESDEPGSIAVEEVEVAVDELLSEVNSKLRECGRREVDSLSNFFERYYGVNSDIAGSALDFEDAINGYVGLIFGGYLESANEMLHAIVAFVREEIRQCNQQSN